MTLPKELSTVTPLSKTIALIMFITFPITAFLFGMKYQQAINQSSIKVMPKAFPLQIPKDQDETVNWKTYINQKFNYQLQYPSNWIFTVDNKRQIESIKSPSDSQINISVDFPFGYECREKFKEKNIVVSGINVTEQEFIGITTNEEKCGIPKSEHLILIDFKYRTNQYDITFYFNELKNQTDLEVFNKMISSFKFLDQSLTSLVDQTNWLTYKTDLEKISFKYPPYWKFEKNGNGVILTSPQGFRLIYEVSGIQGGPDVCVSTNTFTCPTIVNYSIVPIKVNVNNTLYLVHGSMDNQKTVYVSSNPSPDKAVTAGGGVFYDVYMKSRIDPQRFNVFYGSYQGIDKQDLKYQDFYSLEDIQTADSILKSIVFF